MEFLKYDYKLRKEKQLRKENNIALQNRNENYGKHCKFGKLEYYNDRSFQKDLICKKYPDTQFNNLKRYKPDPPNYDFHMFKDNVSGTIYKVGLLDPNIIEKC